MALPRIDKPLFEMLNPSTGKMMKFRPFVVKEEKILLTAQQSGVEKEIILAIKQVLQNCAADPEFDVDTLTTFDLEYMFLKLRARSVNNMIEVSYRDLEDEKVYDFEIDLDKVEMLKPSDKSNNIKVTDEIGIMMKYPSVTILDDAPEDITPAELVEYLVCHCIDNIYDEENVYPAKDYTMDEIKEFVENLDTESFGRIRDFFDSLPQMYYKIEYTNSLGNQREIELTTLSDFFTWG